MNVVYGLDGLSKPLDRCVLTIGNFDGVHLAHRQLLAQAGVYAAQSGAPVVALTFEPHPLAVVAPDKVPPRLTSLKDKLALLDQLGVDLTIIARSEPALLHMEAELFVDSVIRERFRPTHIVEGPSFGFGKGRRGNAELLRRLAPSFGCEVHIVDPVRLTLDDGQHVMVTSSLIRELLLGGHVRRAAMCLGRNHTITGNVVAGDQRGRQLGFPTANLDGIEQLIPMEGVYSGLAEVAHRRFSAAISIGRSPTFDGRHVRVEAHLLDFSGDLYGQCLRLEFVRFLRRQMTFASAEALIAQLQLDVQAARLEEPERRTGARLLEGVNG